MRREDIVAAPAYGSQSEGFERAALIDRSTGSVHMGLGLCALDDGHVDLHVHSFEESFYVLEGAPALYLEGRGVTLLPGACGVVPVGVPHAWRAERRPRDVDRHAVAAAAAIPAKASPTRSSSARRRRRRRRRSTSGIRAVATCSASTTGRWISTS